MMRERDVPRTASLVFLTALTTAAALVNAFASLPLLGLACTLSGFAFGGMQGLAPAITSEIFGMTHFATNYSLLQLGPAVGESSRAWDWGLRAGGLLHNTGGGTVQQRICTFESGAGRDAGLQQLHGACVGWAAGNGVHAWRCWHHSCVQLA